MTLLKGLTALVLKPSSASGIPAVSSSLTGEEWDQLLRLQDEEWKFFGPLGEISLPAVMQFTSGVFVPSATQVSAELMKEAGVNETSSLYDAGAGIGSALVNAGVFFGARGFGREVIPELAGVAQRWIAYLESPRVGLLRPGQVRVERGDAFSVSPEQFTHIYSFPPASDAYYRAFDDWVVREGPRMAPGAKLVILPEDTLLDRSFQKVFPAISSSGAWHTLRDDRKGIILEHRPAGLEEGVADAQGERTAEAMRIVLGLVNNPDISSAIPVIKDLDQAETNISWILDSVRTRLQELGYQGNAWLLSPARLPGAAPPQSSTTVYVEQGREWTADVEKQLEAYYTLVTDSSAAGVVIGDRARRILPAQAFIGVDSARVARHITAGLLKHLEQRGLLKPGYMLLLYKGDLDEDVLLFA